MRAITASLFALSLLGALPAAAQEEGSRVRVAPSWRVSGDRWIVGTLVSRGADSLVVRRADTDETVSFHRRDLNTLQVSTGHRSRTATVTRYAAIGTAAGATAGAVLGTVAHREEGGLFSRRGSVALGAALLGLPAMVIGGAVGWAASGEQWAAVPLTPTVTAGPDGGVGVALSFKL